MTLGVYYCCACDKFKHYAEFNFRLLDMDADVENLICLDCYLDYLEFINSDDDDD